MDIILTAIYAQYLIIIVLAYGDYFHGIKCLFIYLKLLWFANQADTNAWGANVLNERK